MPKKSITQVASLPVPLELIERRIYVIRGQKVMLDADLAELYEVETRALNQAYAAMVPASQGTLCFS